MSDEEYNPKRKIGLRVKSPIDKPSVVSKDEFERQANDQFDKIQDYKQQIWDLSVKYKSFIESKVLPENKGPMVMDLEKEILEKLIIIAGTMNMDQTQDEGSGNTTLCMLLMKCMLIQRDIIIKLSYKVDALQAKNAL